MTSQDGESKLTDAATADDSATAPLGLEEIAVGAERVPTFSDSELVIGLVGAVGTELKQVTDTLDAHLKNLSYEIVHIKVSGQVIPQVCELPADFATFNEFKRISELMSLGDLARERTLDNGVLARGVAAVINATRATNSKGEMQRSPRRAYIVDSLKHPEEVRVLRQIYPQGFYLIGVHSDLKRRKEYLVKRKKMEVADAESLIRRDEDENLSHGQSTRETFHLSDFFVRFDGQIDHLRNALWRILELLFGHPYRTPTFDEFAMFMAHAAALRSADLSRQVGAVVARDNQILSTGANDCPCAGGGLYMPFMRDGLVQDAPNGRDYVRGRDSNKIEQNLIIESIVAKLPDTVSDKEAVRDVLAQSKIRDLTEFGRVVHAEMEALLSCARAGIATKDGALFCTTFPCHNCAKHIIAAGIMRVVFIEPYPKSKALEFHDDAIKMGFEEPTEEKFVRFEPFVGVGPRRFFDIFSAKLGSGSPMKRGNEQGTIVQWDDRSPAMRIQMAPMTYIELEMNAADVFAGHCEQASTASKEETGHVQI